MSVYLNNNFQCRNTIILLNSIINYFPTTKEMGEDLEKAITKSRDKLSKYEDLDTMALRYTSILNKKIETLPNDLEIVNHNNSNPNNNIIVSNIIYMITDYKYSK